MKRISVKCPWLNARYETERKCTDSESLQTETDQLFHKAILNVVMKLFRNLKWRLDVSNGAFFKWWGGGRGRISQSGILLLYLQVRVYSWSAFGHRTREILMDLGLQGPSTMICTLFLRIRLWKIPHADAEGEKHLSTFQEHTSTWRRRAFIIIATSHQIEISFNKHDEG